MRRLTNREFVDELARRRALVERQLSDLRRGRLDLEWVRCCLDLIDHYRDAADGVLLRDDLDADTRALAQHCARDRDPERDYPIHRGVH